MHRLGKKIAMVLLIACLAWGFAPGLAQAQSIGIFLNGQKLTTTVAPQVDNNRVLVPIRLISESLGATVNYYPQGKKIEIIQSGSVVNLQIGSRAATVGGKAHTLDVIPKVVQETTLVPLRFVGESLGVTVHWDNTAKQVLLSKGQPAPGVPDPTADLSKLEGDLLNLINKGRASMGLDALVLAEPLQKMARLHSYDMLENGFFSHISPVRGDLEQRGNAQGLSGVGENIAMGYPDAESVYAAWMDSPTHRDNILAEEAVFIGIGFAKAQGSHNSGFYCTANFLWGEGFFTMTRGNKVQGASVSVNGYAAQAGEILVFRLDPANEDRYINRSSVAIKPGAAKTFQVDVPLPEKGIYLLTLGNDRLRLDNR